MIDDQNIDLVERGIDIGLRVGQLGNSTLIARRIAQCQRRVIGTASYFNAAGVPQIPDSDPHSNPKGMAFASFIESQMLNRDRFQQQMGAEN